MVQVVHDLATGEVHTRVVKAGTPSIVKVSKTPAPSGPKVGGHKMVRPKGREIEHKTVKTRKRRAKKHPWREFQ